MLFVKALLENHHREDPAGFSATSMMGTLLDSIVVVGVMASDRSKHYDDSGTGLQEYQWVELFYQLLDYCGLHLGLSLGEAEQY